MRNPDITTKRRVIRISWNQVLAETRALLLRSAGFPGVMSALDQRVTVSGNTAALQFCPYRVGGGTKLPEATFGVEATQPKEFIRIVRQILGQ